jgi:hypothetical protein
MELHATITGPVHRRIRTDLGRTFQMRRSALDRYLIEMVEQETWAEGLRQMLADYRLARRPWPVNRGEHLTWVRSGES